MTNPELDAWIAENVMGWTAAPFGVGDVLEIWKNGDRTVCWMSDFKPTKKIADAWMVVRAMRDAGYRFQFSSGMFGLGPQVAFYQGSNFKFTRGATDELAICLAAKAAKGGDAS